MPRQEYRTGRADRVRAFLASHANEAFTAREIRDAVEPGGCTSIMGATLSTLASAGQIVRVGAGKGRVHFSWPMGQPKPQRARRQPSTPKPAKRVQVLRAAEVKRSPRPRAVPAPRIPQPVRRVETNFPAPLATVDQTFCPRRAASAQLAADIAEFERRGGKVERLGVTKIFHHPIDCED